MAESEVRTIRVVITLEGSDLSGVSADVEGDVSADISGDGKGYSKDSSKTNKRIKAYAKSQLLGYSKKIVNFAGEMVNSYYNLEENYKANTAMDNAKLAISSSISFVQSIAVGFAVGGPIGAVVAGISSAAQFYNENVGKVYMNEAARLCEMAYSKRYKAEALGLIDGSRGTEN